MASCETNGHVWNAAGHCIFCKTPKPVPPPAPTGLDPCPFCASTNIKLFKHPDEEEFAQCQDCSTCGPNHQNGRHWNVRSQPTVSGEHG